MRRSLLRATTSPRPTLGRRRLPALLGEMHVQLRTEGSTPAGNAVAVGLGTLIGCLPLYGLHLLLCLACARAFRVSRLKAYLAAHVNNPFTAPALIYLEIGLGHWLLSGSWPDLPLGEVRSAGLWLAGLDLAAGSLVVGSFLGCLFGTAAFQVGRRWRTAPFVERLIDATARRYLPSGVLHWEFVRGKLRYDPVYRAILTSGALPREGRLVDLGCGRGILLSLIDTARRREVPGAAPPGWEPPSRELRLVGHELRPRLAAVARTALAGGGRIESGDAGRLAIPPARTVILLDVLHYLSAAEQEGLLSRAAAALEPGGVLLLREADAGLGWRFLLTRAAERLCALGRGHWRQRFCYRSAAAWREILEGHGLTVCQRPMWAGTPYANQLIEARKPSPGSR